MFNFLYLIKIVLKMYKKLISTTSQNQFINYIENLKIY